MALGPSPLPPPPGEGWGGGAPPPTPCPVAGSDQPGAPRVWALATPGAPARRSTGKPEDERQDARSAARAALRRLLAEHLGCAPDDLALSSVRGQAPRLLRQGAGRSPGVLGALHLSISHAPGLSLLAWCEGAALGVDVQAAPRDAPVPELLRTAALYLEPNTAQALAQQAQDASFFEAFTHAWSLHEARLKCLGQPLAEWSPTLGRALAPLHAAPLRLPPWAPPQHTAALAWSPI